MTEIRQLIASSAFSDLDRHFAAFIEAHAGRGSHSGLAPGVRPSSGAATSAGGGVLEFSSMLVRSEAAAPEDGRTPA